MANAGTTTVPPSHTEEVVPPSRGDQGPQAAARIRRERGVVGVTSGSSLCQSTAPDTTTNPLPWSDHSRADAKTALLAYALQNPEGVRPTVAARAVIKPDARGGDRDARLARRFYEGHPDLFKIDRRGGDTWVEPRPSAFILKRSMERVGTPDGGGMARHGDETPRERVQAMLEEVRGVHSDKFRAVLLREFARHADMTDESLRFFGNRETGEVLAVPCGDRYSDEREAAALRARAERVLDAATEAFDVATWVTLTVPRGCIESVASSVSDVRGFKNRLHDRLAYDPSSPDLAARPGRVPPNAVFAHPHGDAVAHLHVVYFGVARLMDWRALRALWKDAVDAHGPVQADVRALALRGDRWVVRRGSAPDAEEYGSIREYLLEPTRDLARLASSSPSELHERADRLAADEGTEQDRDLAALAMYWTAGCEVVTASPGLRRAVPNRRSSGETSSPWTFLGVYTYDRAPRWLRERAIYVPRRGLGPPRDTDPPPRMAGR